MPSRTHRWTSRVLIGVLLLATAFIGTPPRPVAAGSATAVSVATFLCPSDIQSQAELAAAGGVWEACKVAVLPADYHEPPDGYTSNLVSSVFAYEMTYPGRTASLSDSALDGGGTCNDFNSSCTYGYSYLWWNVQTARARVEALDGPRGYRPGAVFVTNGEVPEVTDDSAVVDLTNGVVTFDATTQNVYIQFVWFAGYQDVVGSPFLEDVFWLAQNGITGGCGGAGFRFCAKDPVTRGQMAAFLVRALDLPGTTQDSFTDTAGHLFRNDINALAASGIAAGCGGGRYCPNAPVTRAQMASFLVRALGLPTTASDFFTDDEASMHEADINRLAASGIARGCAEGRYCPNQSVTREQMAAFLHRALD